MRVIPAHLRTLTERKYQVAEKEKDIFDDDEDVIQLPFRVKAVRIVYYNFLSTAGKFRTVKIQTLKFSNVTSVRK